MTSLPSRLELVVARVGFAAAGAAAFGVFEAARSLRQWPLGLHFGGGALVIALGALTSGAVGAGVGLLLAPLPNRPLGRSRWLAFLVGVAVPVAMYLYVLLFTDPPPFQAPAPGHGSVPVFAGVLVALAAAVIGLYQGVRGANSVSTAALVLASAGGAWAWTGGSPAPAPAKTAPSSRPNILLVTLDTTRADRMGAYGNTSVDTRHFDAVAAAGVRFANATAVAAVTGPSHTAMLTGTGPWDNGVLLNGIPIPATTPLLSERLRASGWHTGAFVSAYVLDGTLGFSRGFEVYDDDFGLVPGLSELLVPRAITMAHRHADPDWILERRGADTVDHAMSWIGDQDGPWFAWVHLFDAHGPYAPPPPFDTRYYAGDPRDPAHTSMAKVSGIASYLLPSLKGITDLDYVLAQYDGEVSYADSQLGRLLEAVPKDTLLVVVGDHGEALGEHGVWFNHGDDLYETSLHVPFAVRWSGHLEPQVIDHPVSGEDVAPTVLARVGLPLTGMTGVDAIDTARAAAPSMCFDRDTNLAERKAGRITQPKWRLAADRTEAGRFVEREIDHRHEAFDLALDPLGLQDVNAAWAADPARAEALAAQGKRTASLLERDTSRSAVELSDDETEKLRALGYLEQ